MISLRGAGCGYHTFSKGGLTTVLTKMKVYGSRTAAQVLLPSDGGIDTDAIQIKKVTGLGPVQAQATTTQYGTANGERLANTFVGKRNIVINFGLNPDWATQTMEELRAILYTYFMTGEVVKLEFQGDNIPDVAISGTVESCEPDIYSQDPEFVVSVLCPMPNFVAVEPTIITGTVSRETFAEVPATDIEYEGNAPCGFALKMYKIPASVDNIDSWINLFTASPTPETFRFLGVADDDRYLKLSTKLGKKYIISIYTDTGVSESWLGWVDATAGWPKLYPGLNTFLVETGASGTWELTYFAEFGGL